MISNESNSNVKLLIAITALILTSDAKSKTSQAKKQSQKQSQPKNSINCTNDCCWVWKIREIWGLSMTGYSTKTDSCCSKSLSLGVICSGNEVIRIKIRDQGIAKPIPAEIGNLKSLTAL